MAFPVLYTKRLSLRDLYDSDAERIFQLRSDDGVNEYLDRKKTTTLAEAVAFIRKIALANKNKSAYYWVISAREDQQLMGTISLWNFENDKAKAEIGFEMLPIFQKNGFAKEAIEAVIHFGFDTLKLKQIIAVTDKKNDASIKLLHHFHFEDESEDENTFTYTLFNAQ